MKLKKINFALDWVILVLPVLLLVCSIATIFSITSISGKTNIVFDQIIFAIIALIGYFIFSAINYQQVRTYSWYLYFLGLLFLFAVTIFGQETFGSKRWVDLGFFQFQPSEVVKLFLLILIADLFAERNRISFRLLTVVLFLAGIPILLILKQPDLGTALTIIAMVVAVLIAAKTPKKYFVFAVIALIIASPIVWTKLKPYQKQRLTTFMNPASDPYGSGYNVTQSKIAVGSGGLFGRGFGQATQSQLQFLPVAHIDFIFSGWAEMTGFVGSALMVIIFAVLIWRSYYISHLARDSFGQIFCFGVASMFLFQSFVNIGMNIGLMPVTGIPLPFVSYGGTSMVVTMIMFGIMQNIYLRRKALKFE